MITPADRRVSDTPTTCRSNRKLPRNSPRRGRMRSWRVSTGSPGAATSRASRRRRSPKPQPREQEHRKDGDQQRTGRRRCRRAPCSRRNGSKRHQGACGRRSEHGTARDQGFRRGQPQSSTRWRLPRVLEVLSAPCQPRAELHQCWRCRRARRRAPRSTSAASRPLSPGKRGNEPMPRARISARRQVEQGRPRRPVRNRGRRTVPSRPAAISPRWHEDQEFALHASGQPPLRSAEGDAPAPCGCWRPVRDAGRGPARAGDRRADDPGAGVDGRRGGI